MAQSRYQFPMGKVKITKATLEGDETRLYQFPMGKVKGRRHCAHPRELSVSIPYGKGKEGVKTYMQLIKDMYQFPMGKVKRFRFARILTFDSFCINSLWER